MMNSSFESSFKNKVRVRVCGIHISDDSLLLIKHMGLGKSGYIWSPPGGGLQFGEDAEKALIREFKEETGLTIKVEEFLFVNEYIDEAHHAVELFFEVSVIQGSLKLGYDPEMGPSEQILSELRYLTFEELNSLNPTLKHNAFRFCSGTVKINNLRGYHKFKNILIK